MLQSLNSKERVDMPEVVCKFLDIFPEYLPRLSPVREIEFSIKILPRTAPISKEPYPHDFGGTSGTEKVDSKTAR